MTMKNTIKYIAVFAFLVIGNISLKAQPGGPPGGPGGPGCYPPPCVPIDGGLSFLLIAGAAYGGKKMYEMREQKEEK